MLPPKRIQSLLLAVLWGACARKPPIEELYRRSENLVLQNKLAPALAAVEEGLRQTPEGSVDHWRFYLKKAEIARQMKGAPESLRLLEPEPPHDPQFLDARARRLMGQGWAQSDLGRYDLAEKAFEEGLVLARQEKSPDRIARILYSEVYLYSTLAQRDKVEAKLAAADAAIANTGNQDLAVYALMTDGFVLMNEMRFEDALRVLERAHDLMPSKTGPRAVDVLSNIGLCHYRLKDFDKALAVLAEADQITRGADDQFRRQFVLGQIATIYRERRDLANARKYYREALDISTKIGAMRPREYWLTLLTRVMAYSKDWDAAHALNVEAIRMAVDLKDPSRLQQSRNDAALIAEGKGDTAEAIRGFRTVLATPSEDLTPYLDARTELARIYQHSGRDKEATEEYDAALRVMDRTRSGLQSYETRWNYLSSLIEVYQNYVDFLMERGGTERALELAEASRARILQERLGAQDRLGAAAGARTLDAAAYKRIARDTGATLLSYWLGQERSYVWVTTPRQIAVFRLPPAGRIRTLVENYRALIENVFFDPLQSEDSTGRELYEAVLAPVASHIPSGGRIIIAPDGGLHGLNFETLPVPVPRPHYFFEDATISVASSLNLISESLPHPARGGLLMIGDPDGVEGRFPRLPHAAQEIDLVERHFPKSEITRYQSRAAAPDAYLGARPSRFEFVHFTAHAVANFDSPLDSSIILYGPQGSNRLTARAVLSKPLDAELVTLSACRGAGAKTYSGEGLVGFMWAFFSAGAHNIIAGLWDVSDESTPLLMDVLYRELRAGAGPADALHDAKRALLRSGNFRLPYYWAPFQLYIREAGRPSGAAPLRRD